MYRLSNLKYRHSGSYCNQFFLRSLFVKHEHKNSLWASHFVLQIFQCLLFSFFFIKCDFKTKGRNVSIFSLCSIHRSSSLFFFLHRRLEFSIHSYRVTLQGSDDNKNSSISLCMRTALKIAMFRATSVWIVNSLCAAVVLEKTRFSVSLILKSCPLKPNYHPLPPAGASYCGQKSTWSIDSYNWRSLCFGTVW